MSTITELRELTDKLAKACYSYEQLDKEIMSNKEYDRLYDKLLKMEEELGVVLANSPTHKVGYDVMSQLVKVEHSTPMLSLDKTKGIYTLKDKFSGKEVDVSFKLDGLTVVLTYKDGKLAQAVTRGNGLIGEDVTHTIKHAKGVPAQIPTKEEVVLRGEAIINYNDFEYINSTIDEKYKNPRNLASGTVRSLDAKVAVDRKLQVLIFEVINGLSDSKAERLEMARGYGFDIVPYTLNFGDNLDVVIPEMTDKVKEYGLPVDGLVVTIDSVSDSQSLGTTGKFPRASMAFKWQDTTAETTIREIEWSPSRTGLLNPVAIFDPIELEGTTVTRASLHNISIMKDLEIGIGDRVTVYKANMIIPQIDENLTRSGFGGVPEQCPICGHHLSVVKNKDTEVLMCPNSMCKAKLLGRLTHFVSRDAMNINGLSEGILTQLIENGFINQIVDLYKLDNHYYDLIQLDKMGETKVTKLMYAIEDSKEPKLANFINALGIPSIGLGQAKVLAKTFKTWNNFMQAFDDGFDFSSISGFGDEICSKLCDWYEFDWYSNETGISDLLEYINPQGESTTVNSESKISGKAFVITGDVHHFKNRKELQAKIEELGGKATGSVSNKTDYLINNDINSTSNKNKKAKELGIPIITEDDFLNMI